ncbi:MAG: DUF4382 domain-containing protein [Pseudomonadota bacterium]
MNRPQNQHVSPIPLQTGFDQSRLSRDSDNGWDLRSIFRISLGITLIAMILTGCGGGGGSGGSAPVAAPDPSGSDDGSGELLVGITDAEGDFISYTVDVTSLELTRANGDVVETLPLQTRIDFTELTEVTEFLSVATVPAGNYESVVIRMSYENQEILVEDAMGDAVSVVAVDEGGETISDLEMRLNLTTSDVIRIAPGRPAAFSLDFDLQASNEVDLTNAVVVVDPFLLATPELETDREHRVRGVLESVEETTDSFVIKIRPFRHRQGQFGEMSVLVDDNTQYEINGDGFTGPEGLAALGELAQDTPIVTHGVILNEGVVADTVIAGSSVPWTDANALVGVVSARVGNTISLQGAHIEFADGTKAYRGDFEIELTDDTSVSSAGVDNALVGIQNISVGTRLVAWGEFVDDISLNADRVRINFSQLAGQVVQADPIAVDLFSLNGRRPEFYDFEGTGVIAEDDADPAFYEIDTAGFSQVDAGSLVRVRGLVNDFGLAPADYVARTVIDVDTDHRGAQLKVSWTDGSAVPFNSIGTDGIDIDLADARFALRVRGVPQDLIGELSNVLLQPTPDGLGVYAVKVRGAGEVHMYRNFADLVDELINQLDQGRMLHRISSVGAYNVGDTLLTSPRAGFIFATSQSDEE